MSVFEHRSYDDHEKVLFCRDPESGLRAIIAIHNTRLGHALGGCRMYPYPSSEAALDDVLRLSRGMTYKSALAGLPLGGGKSVIIGDPHSAKSEALLRAMGRSIEGLNGEYVVAEDAGIGERDVETMALETAHVAGVRSRTRGAGDPSPATAAGVMAGIRVAVQRHLQRPDLRGLRVAIQGLGNVGFELARRLHEAGAQLLVTDLLPERSAVVASRFGAIPVPAEDIFNQQVDVIAPCALGAVVDDVVLNQLRARIVAGSANNQLASDDLGCALQARGILYVPDYAINAGGIIDVYLQSLGVSRAEAYEDIERRVERTVEQILEISARSGRAPNLVADELARQRFAPGPQPLDNAA